MATSFAPACVVGVTDDTGVADVSIRIPGNFSGYDATRGRFMKGAEIWAATPADGDRVYNFRMEDRDGILAQIPDVEREGHMLSERYPNYPVLSYFQDQDVAETDSLMRGVFLHPAAPLKLSAMDLDGKAQVTFVPSGMYIGATFKSGVTEAGRKARCNFMWMTWEAG